MFITKRIHIRYCLLVAAAASVIACGKDDFGRPGNNTVITPVIKDILTRSSESALPGELVSERIADSADGFEIAEIVYENNLPSDCPYSTKAAPITSEIIEGFNMLVFADDEWYDNTISPGDKGSINDKYDAGLYFEAGCVKDGTQWKLTKTDGKARVGTGDDAGALYWLNDVPMSFWSYNYDVKPTRTNIHTATFNYTVPSDISAQKDLVYAFSSEKRTFYDDGNDYGELKSSSSTSGASNDEVNIWFYHALSAIQFIQDESLTDYRISAVEIQNVYGASTCVITSTDDTPSSTTKNLSFDHTPSGSLCNFSTTYTASDPSLAIPAGGTGKTYKQADSKTFFMIPQAIGSNVKLKVTFTNTTTGETTSPVFLLNKNNTDGVKWQAGKYYIYKLDLSGNIHVDISEECTSTAKSDVKFKNTSSVNEYIRAAVVANWYDASGNIVASWDKTRDGNFSLGSGWSAGTDGYYYYSNKVATEDYTGNLFSSFTKPTNPPVAGAHFEMAIIVQAVCSDGISSCQAAFN